MGNCQCCKEEEIIIQPNAIVDEPLPENSDEEKKEDSKNEDSKNEENKIEESKNESK